jgi:proline iminopeptidase
MGAPAASPRWLSVALALCLLVSGCSHSRPATDLHLRVVGSGRQVVILLHGGPGLSLEEMRPYEALARPELRLVSYDQRGAGRSPSGRLDLQSQVADLDGVRRSQHANRIWLLGHSWGGMLAAAYTAAHPDQVAGLVLLDGAPPDVDAFHTGQAAFAAKVDELTRLHLLPSPLPPAANGSCLAAIKALAPVYSGDPQRPVTEPDGTTCTDGVSAKTFADILRPGVLSSVAAGLQGYHGPVLVLAGSRDPFGASWPVTWKRLLPEATLTIVPGAGHDPLAQDPAAVLTTLAAFLRVSKSS